MRLTPHSKDFIDRLSYEELLSHWHESDLDDTWFKGETGAYWANRLRACRLAHTLSTQAKPHIITELSQALRPFAELSAAIDDRHFSVLYEIRSARGLVRITLEDFRAAQRAYRKLIPTFPE